VIGTEALGVVGSVKDATATTAVEEFLEPAGTAISAVEAEGLENLLRKALRYLPEQRLAPSELAKHH
jgi:serine/threonine-protein kinase SRPK3